MNAFKKFAALLLALMMILSLAACGSKSDDSAQGSSDGDASPDDTAKSKIEQIKEAGVLVMGTSADYPPNEFHTEVDGKDTIVGFDVAIAQYIADDLGVELKVVDILSAICYLTLFQFFIRSASHTSPDISRQIPSRSSQWPWHDPRSYSTLSSCHSKYAPHSGLYSASRVHCNS